MKLYHVSLPNDHIPKYDSYSEFVVAAYNEKEARSYHPSGSGIWDDASWISKEYVGILLVKLIGSATNNVTAGTIIVASK